MEDELVLMLAAVANRSRNQEKDLFVLCENNIHKLLKLEAGIKRLFIHYCPADEKTVDKICLEYDELRKKELNQ